MHHFPSTDMHCCLLVLNMKIPVKYIEVYSWSMKKMDQFNG